MSTLGDWISVLVGFVVSILLFNYQQDKKKLESIAKDCAQRDAQLAERVVRVETELMTEREVREIFKEYMEPLMARVDRMANTTEEIKVSIAALPKRANDRG